MRSKRLRWFGGLRQTKSGCASLYVPHENDRWRGAFIPPQPGRYVFALDVWTDQFATWRRDALLKLQAGQATELDAQEGRALLAKVARARETHFIIERARTASDRLGGIESSLDADLAAAMAESGPRDDLTRSSLYPLTADRPIARAGAWYEMIPRSQSSHAGQHGTFDDCIGRLPDVAAMGFDVIYLTPIHPIGHINRKGRNNALVAGPGDPEAPTRLAALRAVTTRFIPNSVRSPTFAALSTPAASRRWR